MNEPTMLKQCADNGGAKPVQSERNNIGRVFANCLDANGEEQCIFWEDQEREMSELHDNSVFLALNNDIDDSCNVCDNPNCGMCNENFICCVKEAWMTAKWGTMRTVRTLTWSIWRHWQEMPGT